MATGLFFELKKSPAGDVFLVWFKKVTYFLKSGRNLDDLNRIYRYQSKRQSDSRERNRLIR